MPSCPVVPLPPRPCDSPFWEHLWIDHSQLHRPKPACVPRARTGNWGFIPHLLLAVLMGLVRPWRLLSLHPVSAGSFRRVAGQPHQRDVQWAVHIAPGALVWTWCHFAQLPAAAVPRGSVRPGTPTVNHVYGIPCLAGTKGCFFAYLLPPAGLPCASQVLVPVLPAAVRLLPRHSARTPQPLVRALPYGCFDAQPRYLS